MLNTILFLAELPVLIGPSFFYLVPKTPIFEQLKESHNIPSDEQYFRSSYMPYETENFQRKDLITLFRITRIINFMKEIKSHYQKTEILHYIQNDNIWKYIDNIAPKYQIDENVLTFNRKIEGNEIRLQLGIALLELLKKFGRIYGIKKTSKNRYQLREEIVNQKIVNIFLNKIDLIDIK